MKSLLLCGIPASGKSTYGRWLREVQGWTFVDVEEDGELERAGLRSAWDESFTRGPSALVDLLRSGNRHIALAWGFPPSWLRIVAALKAAGMALWWFDGDRDAARESCIGRGSGSIQHFDIQMSAIRENWFAISAVFGNHIIQNVHPGPQYTAPEEIFERLSADKHFDR